MENKPVYFSIHDEITDRIKLIIKEYSEKLNTDKLTLSVSVLPKELSKEKHIIVNIHHDDTVTSVDTLVNLDVDVKGCGVNPDNVESLRNTLEEASQAFELR